MAIPTLKPAPRPPESSAPDPSEPDPAPSAPDPEPTLNRLRRHPVAVPGLPGDDGLLDASRARGLATDIGQAVIDLRHISEAARLCWRSVDDTAERLTTAAREIRLCAERAGGVRRRRETA